MLDASWVKTSKQSWKLALCVLTLAVSFVFLVIAFKYSQPEYFILFIFLSLFSISWFVYSIRCPYCSYKIIKHVLFKQEYKYSWFTDTLFLTKCPSCGKDL